VVYMNILLERGGSGSRALITAVEGLLWYIEKMKWFYRSIEMVWSATIMRVCSDIPRGTITSQVVNFHPTIRPKNLSSSEGK